MSYSQKPLPTLSQMPWNIKKAIVHSADLVTRSNLRLCSHDFRCHVDRAPVFYGRLLITVGINSIDIEALPFRLRVESNIESELNNKAIRCLSKILRHREVSVGEFLVLNQSDFLPSLVEFLERKKTLLKAKKFHLKAQMAKFGPLMHRFVSCFQPGLLESMHFKNAELPSEAIDWEAISETEQWKQAKQVMTTGCSMSLPYHKWAHLECPCLCVNELPVETVSGVMQNFYRNPEWRCAQIEHDGRYTEDISAYFEQLGMRGTYLNELRNPFDKEDIFNIFLYSGNVTVLRLSAFKR